VTTDRSHVEANRAELDSMRAFVERATDEDLRTPMPDGWTVASVLAHIAFWDQRVLVLEDQADRGVTPPPYRDEDVDWINDTSKRFVLALEPRVAAQLAVRIAEECDRRVASLSAERRADAETRLFNLKRWEDRREHLDEIEQVLGTRAEA
jgi:hypothetical protein